MAVEPVAATCLPYSHCDCAAELGMIGPTSFAKSLRLKRRKKPSNIIIVKPQPGARERTRAKVPRSSTACPSFCNIFRMTLGTDGGPSPLCTPTWMRVRITSIGWVTIAATEPALMAQPRTAPLDWTPGTSETNIRRSPSYTAK
eukprot:scaffold127197_cov37-Tisochrysis_lutea.AAC.2